MFIILASLSLLIQLLWLLIKRYLTREKRKLETVFNFRNLHPYEQLAVIWLLEAAQDPTSIYSKRLFSIGFIKGDYWFTFVLDAAAISPSTCHLKQSNAMAFELAEIQRMKFTCRKMMPSKH